MTSKNVKQRVGGVVEDPTDERNVQLLHSTSTNISGSVENLQRELKAINTDIKADQVGKQEYEEQLRVVNKRREELNSRISKSQDWLDAFEKDLGPFRQEYAKLVEEIEQIYNTAKEFHGQGVKLLIDSFNYHVAYKRWNDTFTSVPFKPK